MIPLKLSYDDVLIVPKKAVVTSRREICTKTKLTKDISLEIPIVSSNMDSVTESEMAIAIARLGGIGFVHRFMPIADQIEEVKRVKRADNVVIEEPYTISSTATIKEMRDLMIEKGVHAFLVVDAGKLVGLVSKRDTLLKEGNLFIKEVMKRSEDLVLGHEGMSLEEAKKKFLDNKIKRLPLVENGEVKGLITLKDILKREQYPLATRDSKGRLRVGASIGIKDSFFEDAAALVAAGADVLVIDVAHGHAIRVIEVLKKVKELGVPVIVGNVATPEAVVELVAAGADGIKVGVGPGAMCTTRIVAGAGVPQFSAVMECAKVAQQFGVPVIADGGIKGSGDMAKAIGAGASTVMLGTLLAGTDESPGLLVLRKGARYKVVRGMASLGAAMGRKSRGAKEVGKDIGDVVPEGIETIVGYKGAVTDLIKQLVGGFKSGISYAGARSIEEMWRSISFCQMTASGMKESKPHGEKS